MVKQRLRPRMVNKVWGRRHLPDPFTQVASNDDPIGEIWFEHSEFAAPELLVKFIFTSDKLSVQVHPDAAAARATGLARGKDEAWMIVDADEDAVIGLGPKRPLNEDELRQAAAGGSIEELLEWKRVKRGDFFYSPAKTIHAIGAGVSLIEVQENVDATYRLYDYGRGRPLHLDQALAVANLEPWAPQAPAIELSPGRSALAYGGQVVVERWTAPLSAQVGFDQNCPAWVIPITPGAQMDQEQLDPGNVWVVHAPAQITLSGAAELLVAYPGSEVSEAIATAQA